MSQLNLPDTGVNACFDKVGAEIPTPSHDEPLYGQDGCFEVHPMKLRKLDAKGEPMPDAVGWDEGCRMVEDLNTGLVWEVKSPVPGDVNCCDDKYTWEDAQKLYVDNLNKAEYGGFTDWRLPNKDELRSIVHYSMKNPSVDTWYFPHTQIDFYWVKNTYNMQPYFGWVLFFGLGSATACGKTNPQYVRAVRGGHDSRFGEPDPSRFVDNGDGTVTDQVTRLMWQKGENDRMNWYDALEAAKKMDLAGYTDWRLPTIKELNTILNLDHTDGWWYFKEAFPADGLQPPLLHYFSSTPYEGFYAWVTNFCFGYDGYYANKMATLLFRAVRHTDEPPAKPSGVVVLADSGQKDCYDDEGNVIEPPNPGEPFYGQDGNRDLVPFSCVKLRDGGEPVDDETIWEDGFSMVLDNNTGLMWEVKSPSALDINAVQGRYTFEEAQEYVNQMNESAYGGFADWRLPNREELRSIVDYNKYSPAVLDAFDNDCDSEFYWTSDPYGAAPDLIWGIYFAYGCGICYPKINRYAARVVRGGYNPAFGDPARRAYKDNGDGTVTDENCGLMWVQEEGPELNWNDAMAHCEALDFAGHQDWRLPSMREVATLVDCSCSDGAWFDKDFFPNVKTKPLGFYWASSTYASTFGWGVNFQFGYDGYYAGKKQGKYPFRPVRSAR